MDCRNYSPPLLKIRRRAGSGIPRNRKQLATHQLNRSRFSVIFLMPLTLPFHVFLIEIK